MRFNAQNWKVLDVLLEVAKQLSRSPALVALNWVATQPGITSTIIGASKLAQLKDNLTSIEFTIPAELRRRLDEASALPSIHPYMFFESFIQGMISGGTAIDAWQPVRLYPPTQAAEARPVATAERKAS
jgi:diketogulonate reductase-like aldo/keto reductase